MMRVLVFVFLVFVVSSAQQKFVGKIIDAGTGEPISFCAVKIYPIKKGTLTNSEGKFSILLPEKFDSLFIEVSYLDYETYRDTLLNSYVPDTEVIIALRKKEIKMEAVVITPKDNYANVIMKNVLKHRAKHQMSRLEKYKTDTYNKLVITVDNVKEKNFDNPLLKPAKNFFEAYKNDSTFKDSKTGNYKFAVFFSESYTTVYYNKPFRKEVIHARRQIGKESGEVNILSTELTMVDIYENNIVLLGKPFVGPVNPTARLDYYFYLESYEIKPNDTIYEIRLYPKSPYEALFDGYVYVSHHDWAIVKTDLRMNRNPNINFVEKFRILQEFEKIDGEWLLRFSTVNIDFKNGKNQIGLIGEVSTNYLDYDLSPEFPPKFFDETLVVEPGASEKPDSFWTKVRPMQLNKAETIGFVLADSLKQEPLWNFYVEVLEILTTGKFNIAGEKFELGPYSKLFSYNNVEGWRVSLGINSTFLLSKHFYFSGRIAYGLGDKKWKYQGLFRYRQLKRPFVRLQFNYYDEIEQVGIPDYVNTGTGIVSLLNYKPLSEMNYFQEAKFMFSSEITRGIMHFSYLRTKSLQPHFPYRFIEPETNEPLKNYTITEVGTRLRFSIRERYIVNEGEKVSLGSKFPILNLELAYGIKGLLNGDLEYSKFAATITDKLILGRFGIMYLNATAGTINGILPLPSLHIYRGSQSYGLYTLRFSGSFISSFVGENNTTFNYYPIPFNLMHFYEFVADKYFALGIDHHLEGFILNKMPLVRRLKLKELVMLRMAYGKLSQENVIRNPSDTFPFREPFPTPYVEVGLGLENIFKFIQIVYVRRLTYLEPFRNYSNINHIYGFRFGLRASF